MEPSLNKMAGLAILLVFSILLLTIVRTSMFGSVEPSKHIYFEIVFLLLLAVAGELAVVYIKQPSVMILLLLGLFISPSFLSASLDFLNSLNLPIPLPTSPPLLFQSQELIHIFAQLGAIILLFKVGLHSKLEGIFSKENFVVALGGVILPFAVGYLYASTTGGNFAYSMFVGAALTATSVGVTVAILKEMNLVKERFAQIIIGAAVLDDVLGLLVLSFVINVSSGVGSLAPLILTAVSSVVFIVGSIVAGEYFIKYLDRKEMSPRRFLLVLALMLMFAYVAEFISLSAIVGAFMAGIILNRSRHIAEIEDKTYGLEMLFMPIFFITLGMLVDVNALVLFAVPILVLTLIAIVTKLVGCGLGALWAKLDPKQSLAVGIGMAPRGEVALIIASIGLTSGVLNSSQYSIIAMMALLTTFFAIPMLGYVLKR